MQDLSEHQTYQSIGEWTFILRTSWTMTVQTLINLYITTWVARGKWSQNPLLRHVPWKTAKKHHPQSTRFAATMAPLEGCFTIWELLGPTSRFWPKKGSQTCRIRHNYPWKFTDSRSTSGFLWRSHGTHKICHRHWVKCFQKKPHAGANKRSMIHKSHHVGEPPRLSWGNTNV